MSAFSIRSTRSPGAAFIGLLALIGLLATGSAAMAQVQVAPGGGIVFVSSESKAGAVDDPETLGGPDYGVWGTTLTSAAHENITGYDAGAYFTIASSIDTTGFSVSSTGSGQTSAQGGSTSGGAFAAVLFLVDQCQEYSASTYLDGGGLGPIHIAAFIANVGLKDVALTNMITGVGNTAFHGRISPGGYIYYYQNNYGPDTHSGYATTLVNGIHFDRVPNPLITQHPHDQTVPAGSPASFSVGTGGPLASHTLSTTVALTYQWRRNYVNLANGGTISGATTPQFHISSTSFADSGFYDCVVTQADIVEPSSLAHLTVTGGTTDTGPTPVVMGLELSAPWPNPFAASTSIRFALPREAEVRLDVLDVGGRQVRELLAGERREPGNQSVEWDGRTQRGERAASGIYFVRLRAGREQLTRRVVRIAP